MQTNGETARPRASTAQGYDASSFVPSSVYVTAVACCTNTSFFVGHTDGIVRAFSISDGAQMRTFTPPAAYTPDSSVQRGRDVTAIALYGGVNGAPHVLAVGHRDGTVHNYDAGTGAFTTAFKSMPGLTQLLPLRRFASLAAVHAGRNAMQVRGGAERAGDRHGRGDDSLDGGSLPPCCDGSSLPARALRLLFRSMQSLRETAHITVPDPFHTAVTHRYAPLRSCGTCAPTASSTSTFPRSSSPCADAPRG